jgi:phytoene dehydrogenase-like protein
MKQHCNVYDAIIVGGGHNGLVAASYLAKAGKTVLLLEAHDELGGATTSVKPFPEYDARLSRYSYLVSLLPDQIVTDLGINFKTLGRAVASYTPYHRNGQDDGLFISTDWDEATASSFRRLTGSDREGKAWREFYDEIAQLAQRFAPSMLQPLKCAAQLKAERSNCNQRWPRWKVVLPVCASKRNPAKSPSPKTCSLPPRRSIWPDYGASLSLSLSREPN